MEQPADAPKVKQPPVLFSKTQVLINKVTEQLGGVLVTYWNNPQGSVCHNDVVALYELLENIGKQDTISLFIKSSGGDGRASLRLVSLLRQYCRRLIALVPLECASAATMIALGADEILMGPMAYLTPVDTSLTHDLSPLDRDNARVSVSLDELTRVIGLWRNEQAESKENPYKALVSIRASAGDRRGRSRRIAVDHAVQTTAGLSHRRRSQGRSNRANSQCQVSVAQLPHSL